MSAEAAADYLEQMLKAIRERRLYGFMIQDIADSAVGAGEWIEKTTEDAIAEARADEEREKAKENSSNVFDVRRDD